MLTVFNATNKHLHPRATEEMHRLRKKVFHDFLKWDVSVSGDWEIDHYDDANPLYFLSYDDRGKLRGSLRLLPTLGPNMLDDTFPILLGNNPEIRSASIWESSRFCIDPEITQSRSGNQVTVAAAELMCGVGELGIASGLSHIVTVTDVLLERMFRRMGCPGERIADARRIGNVQAVAVAWQVSETLLESMKSVAGLSGRIAPRALSLETARAA